MVAAKIHFVLYRGSRQCSGSSNTRVGRFQFQEEQLAVCVIVVKTKGSSSKCARGHFMVQIR